MTGPALLRYLLAAIMIVTAGYCASRLAVAWLRRRPADPDVDIAHVVMGVAMAGMLVPGLAVLPDAAWAVLSGIGCAWFGWRLVRAYRGAGPDGRIAHHAPHLLASGAMLDMFIGVPPVSSGRAAAGHAMPDLGLGVSGPAAAARVPVLALVLALALLGYVVWITDRIPSLPRVSALRLAADGPPPPGSGSSAGIPAAAARNAGGQGRLARPAPPPRLPRPARLCPRLPRPAPLSLRLSACCEIVMGITMGYMLITMV